MHGDNKDCYDKGLVHCPNKDCKKKVFLTEKDLERHVFMKRSSKNICLQWYRDSKAQALVKMRHGTTQVVFSSLCHSAGYGTLLNDDNNHVNHPTMNSYKDIVESQQFTSRSHLHNVLLAQGSTYIQQLNEKERTKSLTKELLGSLPEKEIIKTKGFITDHSPISFGMDCGPFLFTENDGILNQDHELHDDDDMVTAEHHDKLLNIRRRIDMATSYWNNSFTREDRVCIQLEHMLRKADAPLYLYDDIMQWAYLNKYTIPLYVPPLSRKTLYVQLSRKLYGDSVKDMKPKEIQTTLPSGRRCAISVFNIYSQIVQLLGNKNINQWSNHFFHPPMMTRFT
jgi:hypothetical protein